MRVVVEREGGIVHRVTLLDDEGKDVVLVTRFLAHLADSAYSPNTLCAYAYDLRHLAMSLDERMLAFGDFDPATALEFLGYLRRVPSRRPAQRLGLSVATGQGRLLSPATVARALAATSSLFEWAIAAEAYTEAGSPMQRQVGSATSRSSATTPPPSRLARDVSRAAPTDQHESRAGARRPAGLSGVGVGARPEQLGAVESDAGLRRLHGSLARLVRWLSVEPRHLRPGPAAPPAREQISTHTGARWR